jgi:hypothetical protein
MGKGINYYGKGINYWGKGFISITAHLPLIYPLFTPIIKQQATLVFMWV